MPRRFPIAASLSLLSMALSGCAAQRHADHMISTATGVTDKISEPPKADPSRGNPTIAHVDSMYFGQSAFRRRRGEAFPPRVERVTVRSNGEVDLREFATLIAKATGVPVAINIGKASAATNAAAGNNGNSSAMLSPPIPNMSATGYPIGQGGIGAMRGGIPTMPVLWDGPLAELLDLGAARFGVDWEYRDGVIQIADERTETFILHALPTSAQLDNQLTTTTGGDSGSSGSSTTAGGTTATSKLGSGQKAALDIWADIKTALAVIVGDRGRFAITPANGTITVTAPPAVLNQVSNYIRIQNSILTRQVFVRLRVYSVSLAEGDDSALSFNTSFQNAAKSFGLAWSSPGTAPTSSVGSFTASVLSATSPLAGSDVVAKALASTSNTSLITELNLSALNNRPVTKQDVRTESYISQTSVTTQQTSSTTSLVPATLATGFTVSLLPRIITDNRILLGYSINLSSLVNLQTQSSGGSIVQLPTIDSSGGLQEIMLQSGQVLMLMGYVADNAVDTRQGTGVSSNFLLGGTRSSSTSKKRIIITMEPVITSEAGE